MRVVFADTFYFFALLSERDAFHEKAVAFSETYSGRILTTGWVLTELGDGWSKPQLRGELLPLIEGLRSDESTEIVSFSDELFEEGLQLYSERPDKEWSLTDCLSFVVMEREGLTEALTGDHHFEQAGFVALLKP